MEIRSIPVEQINPAPYNPRVDLQPGDPEYEKLRRSIEEFGFVEPLVWNRRTGHLVGGHQRLKILLAQGAREVQCSVVDLDLQREQALNLALNRIGGDWDQERLAELLAELQVAGDIDLALTGFDREEIDDLLRDIPEAGLVREDDFDVEAEIEQIEDPVTQPGDLWILGRHRLLCGDATRPGDVERLMDGQLATMVFTDPPYNVDYQGKTKDALRIENDCMTSQEFYSFLLAAFRNMHAATVPGAAFYVCHADSEAVNFRRALADAGWLVKQTIIWAKHAWFLGRQDYQWQHEPILYGWKAGGRHRWFGGRRQPTVWDGREPVAIIPQEDGAWVVSIQVGGQEVALRVPSYEVLSLGGDPTTVWRIPRPVRNAEHPTMKPVGVPARAIINSSRSDEIALDLFLGGGSTLIAAEQTNRICFGMELDRRYCDAVVKRWEQFTGQQATRLPGQQVAAARA